MARRRRSQVVIEDLSEEMLNATRDAERVALNNIAPQARQELHSRAARNEHTGNYSKSLFAEVPSRRLELVMGSSAPHAHLVEFGTGPRETRTGASRGSMPKLGVIRRAARKMRKVAFQSVVAQLKQANIRSGIR